MKHSTHPNGQPQAHEDFVAQARPDVLNPIPTDADVARTIGFEAPGHIAHLGNADAMDEHFEEQGKHLLPAHTQGH